MNCRNEQLLIQVNADCRWFRAMKTQPIWAIQIDSPQLVRTLEGSEQVESGSFLCRGEAGDVWPQTGDSLHRRYLQTDEWSQDGWQKYVPHPDSQGVMAIQMERPFQVHTAWGLLCGKAGDFLLKPFEDRDNLFPENLWIVDRFLFDSTYERRQEFP